MRDTVEQLQTLARECATTPVWSLGDDDLLACLDAIHATEQTLTALKLHLIHQADTRDLPTTQHAPTCALWLRHRLRITPHTAKRLAELAQHLNRRPDLDAALADGTLNTEQAHVIATTIKDLPAEIGAEAITKAETMLIDYAEEFDPLALRKLGTRILAHIAPEAAEKAEAAALARQEAKAHTSRGLTLTPHRDGRVRITGWLDHETAAVINAALDPLCTPSRLRTSGHLDTSGRGHPPTPKTALEHLPTPNHATPDANHAASRDTTPNNTALDHTRLDHTTLDHDLMAPDQDHSSPDHAHAPLGHDHPTGQQHDAAGVNITRHPGTASPHPITTGRHPVTAGRHRAAAGPYNPAHNQTPTNHGRSRGGHEPQTNDRSNPDWDETPLNNEHIPDREKTSLNSGRIPHGENLLSDERHGPGWDESLARGHGQGRGQTAAHDRSSLDYSEPLRNGSGQNQNRPMPNMHGSDLDGPLTTGMSQGWDESPISNQRGPHCSQPLAAGRTAGAQADLSDDAGLAGAGHGLDGDEQRVTRDERTPAQRRVDALVEVCRLVLASRQLPDNGGDRPQVVVTVPFDVLRQQLGTATLDTGERLSATQARRLACDASIIPAVLGGDGQVLDLGTSRRLFTGALRRALVLRDRGCTFPGCDRHPRWTEGHHIRHWSQGGATTLDNGALLCGAHHRVIHQGDWTVRLGSDRLPEFVPPSYLDPERRPRRNIYHQKRFAHGRA